MRGRFHLLAALFLLSILPSAQAGSAFGAVVKGDPLDGAIDEEVGAKAVSDEVCVDVSSAFDDDPTKIIVIAAQCTVTVTVSVGYNEEGRLVVTLIVIYAGFAYSCAIESADPGNLPQVGDHVHWKEPCWKRLKDSMA